MSVLSILSEVIQYLYRRAYGAVFEKGKRLILNTVKDFGNAYSWIASHSLMSTGGNPPNGFN